jgi:hypothetical protein
MLDIVPDTIKDTQIHEVETLRYKGETLLDMGPDIITDTQIHEVETLRYSWGRLYWARTLTPSQTPRSTRWKHSGTAGGETLLDMDPDTITDTQFHEVETLRYS